MKHPHVVIGAGPAGLTAAWQLTLRGEHPIVLESDPEQVGGLARTVRFDGHGFDIGPHRFYTKSDEVQEMWQRMLPDDFVEVSRLTRIFYGGDFYSYPIRIGETLRNLGLWRAAKVGASYLRARVDRSPVESFEDWVVRQFGRELYLTFFKTYTEKVWGVPCNEIDKDWAAQRIRGLSLGSAIKNALFGAKRSAGGGGGGVKSLVERFSAPRRGAGQLWDAVRDEVVEAGGCCELGASVVRIEREGGRVLRVHTADGRTFEGETFYATMTLRDLVRAMDPPPPEAVLAAGMALRQRDFVVVTLLVDAEDLFPDQWIYIHDPEVAVARISNFENWNQDRDDGQSRPTRLALEYFFNRDESFFQKPDAEIVAQAKRELVEIGLTTAETEVRGKVFRVEDAYPVYDHDYAAHRDVVREWLVGTFENLFPAGRRGLHNYNSQDHAMMSAAMAVSNRQDGARYDVWSVNTEQEYAEEGEAKQLRSGTVEERLTPRRRELAPTASSGRSQR